MDFTAITEINKNDATKCLGVIAFQWKSWTPEYNSYDIQ